MNALSAFVAFLITIGFIAVVFLGTALLTGVWLKLVLGVAGR